MILYRERKLSLYHIKEKIREMWDLSKKPLAARREYIRDNLGVIYNDPGHQKAIDSGMDWLCQAQDNNEFGDGGVADAYYLTTGWGPSYPETTGYIIPTFIEYGRMKRDAAIIERAKRMLDWLCAIQLSDGSFQGGVINAEPRRPTVFNTGQIIMGLAAGVKEFAICIGMVSCAQLTGWLRFRMRMAPGVISNLHL